MIGLERGVVRLSPYTAEWKRLFEEEKALLQAAIGPYVLDIQHVGSTSIPGMVAKPIIDIGIAVTSFEEARICIQPVEQLGYQYRGEHGIPRRHFFVKGDPRTHHLHMNEAGSDEWENHVLFRDALIQHPGLAEEYAALKAELAQRYPADREAYLDGKAPFIERVLELARSARDHIQIRELEAGDPAMIAAAFQAIGWNKPESLYRKYLEEQEMGKRAVLVAFREGTFAGYGTIVWSSAYAPFREKGIPEISDLNVLPQFRRKGIASAIMDRAEAMISERSDRAGIAFGLDADYGAAQRMYVLRGYVPDGSGATYECKPVAGGQPVRVDDKLVLWLVKKLKAKR